MGVVEITADNQNKVGILANASRILAEHGISIRQALVDDPELNSDPKLTLIGDRVIPEKAIPLILKNSRSRQGVGLLVTETHAVTKGNIY